MNNSSIFLTNKKTGIRFCVHEAKNIVICKSKIEVVFEYFFSTVVCRMNCLAKT